MLEAAIHYAELGYPVFPLAPGKKTPWISKDDGGNGCLDAVVDFRQIERWWSKEPYCNIGIACGVNSGIFVIDVDPAHGGEDSVKRLIQQGYAFTETPLSKTQSGGYHIFYEHYDGAKNSTSKIAKGIDTRGDGGYIVAPPSIIFGWDKVVTGEYRWCYGFDIRPVARVPDWIRRKLSEEKEVKIDVKLSGEPTGSLEALARFLSRAPEGQRNSSMFWAAARAGELVRSGKTTAREAEAVLLGATMGSWNNKEMHRTLTTLRNGLRRSGAL